MQVSEHHDIYDTKFYRRLRGWIGWCVERRLRVLLITLALFIVSLAAFTLVPQQFFPSSDRTELLVDLRLPEGASFAATLRETQRFEASLAKRPEIDHFIDFVGSGAPRFYLPLDQQLTSPNFAQFVVTAKTVKDREKLAKDLDVVLRNDFPTLRTRISRLENGPPIGFPVQFRVTGPEIGMVRQLSEQVAQVMRAGCRHDQCPGSTGTNRPSARCISKSTRPRRAHSIFRRRTLPTICRCR